MNHGFAQKLGFSAPRRVLAVLLAIFLNLALVPCTMALEVVESGHDCCPPELSLSSYECCAIDDVSVDRREGSIDFDHADIDMAAIPERQYVPTTLATRYSAATDPPDPPDRSVAIHKLNCVYLK